MPHNYFSRSIKIHSHVLYYHPGISNKKKELWKFRYLHLRLIKKIYYTFISLHNRKNLQVKIQL